MTILVIVLGKFTVYGAKCTTLETTLGNGENCLAKLNSAMKGVHGAPFATTTIAFCSIFRIRADSGNESSTNSDFSMNLFLFAICCCVLMCFAVFCCFPKTNRNSARLLICVAVLSVVFCSFPAFYFAWNYICLICPGVLCCCFCWFVGRLILHDFAVWALYTWRCIHWPPWNYSFRVLSVEIRSWRQWEISDF